MLDVVNAESTADAVTPEAIAKLAKGRKANAKKLVMHASPHAILFSPHVSPAFGHQQWIFFDDSWASANADLASSILRYASGWDPFSDGDDDDDD
jgi:3-oxoacyl-ACP reductase-like protein